MSERIWWLQDFSCETSNKKLRRYGELCGYFYGRNFWGLNTIMSDKDQAHLLDELQKARAEIDRLREMIRWRKYPEEKPAKSGEYLNFYFFENGEWGIYESYFSDGSETDGEIYWNGRQASYWRPIGNLPEGGE